MSIGSADNRDAQACITVVMPTFNSARTLPDALAPLITSPLVGEILVADGGSSDETCDILAKSGSRVKLRSTQDTGLYDGVNRILAGAEYPNLVFMNSDDIVEPSYLSQAVEILKEGKADFVYGDIQYGSDIKKARFEDIQKPAGPFQRMPFPHVSLVMATPLFTAVGKFNTDYSAAADLDFINRLLSITRRGHYVPKIAAVCCDDGLTSGNIQVWESAQVAVRHGRSWIAAYALASLILLRRWTRPLL